MQIISKISRGIVLAFFLAVLFSCEGKIKKIDQIISKDSLPEISVDQVQMLYSDSGIVRMKLFAKALERYTSIDSPYIDFPKGVMVFFFTKQKAREASLNAGWAHYDEKKDLWEYRTKVKIVNRQGDILTTNHLFADRRKDSLYTKELVTINSADGFSITGKDGFRSNVDFTDYEFETVVGTGKAEE